MAKFVRKEGQDHGMIDAHPSNWIKKGMKCIYTPPFLCKIVASELTYSSQLANFSMCSVRVLHITVMLYIILNMRRCNFQLCVKSHACTISHTAMLAPKKQNIESILESLPIPSFLTNFV